MGIIERWRAAANERKVWLSMYVLLGGAMLVMGVRFWDLWWTIPCVLGGLVMVVCGIIQELYRHVLGTLGLIAVMGDLAIFTVVFLCLGLLSWGITSLIGPVCCLSGVVVFWRDRPRDSERYMVTSEAGKYISKLTEDLQRIEPQTPFHPVIGRDFSSQVEQAADWLASVYDQGAEDFKVTAIFVEMNRFDINTDQWYLEGSTFSMPVGDLFEDLEYNLGEYEDVCDEEFVLTGVEDIQAAFEQTNEKDIFASEDPDDMRLMEAMGIAFDLITLRAMEMLASAHCQAARTGHKAGSVRVFANVHDSMLPPVCMAGKRV